MRAPAMTTTRAIFVAMVPGSAADGGCSHKASAIDSISRTHLVNMLELPGKWCFTTPRMLKMEFVVCDFSLCASIGKLHQPRNSIGENRRDGPLIRGAEAEIPPASQSVREAARYSPG
jgi:hypothetical protein